MENELLSVYFKEGKNDFVYYIEIFNNFGLFVS